ncbi:MAG: 3-isopropylmalate dehydrogenase [Solirubrobacterales bacterium]|nr:3-isopropylmalate dehydrogenase [Solirubrobacterales bacterium]
MSETSRIVVLAGDGIGPEIVDATRQVLDAVGEFEYTEHLIGGASIDEHGVALTDEVTEACKASDAVLLGAVGGPKWDEAVAKDPTAPRPEQGLLGIRKALGLYANLRPVKPSPALIDSSPLKKELIDGTDLLVVRELTGGIYFGDSGRRDDNGGTAYDECAYSVPEITRITVAAFEAARQRSDSPRVTSVDKANVLESSRLWRETVKQVAEGYPDVELDHMLVDNTAMQLVSRPADFDVIVTENLFGDILSDEAAMLTGSLGMLPSASIGAEGQPGLFEPVHGSAPDIAGQGVANPLATMLSAAMMLRYGLGRGEAADRIEQAVDTVLASGLRTPDLYSGAEGENKAGTAEVTAAVLAEVGQR